MQTKTNNKNKNAPRKSLEAFKGLLRYRDSNPDRQNQNLYVYKS